MEQSNNQKLVKDEDTDMTNKLDVENMSITRRNLIVWTTPAVAAIALPAHAQLSECTEAEPIATVVFGPKCAGDPIVSDITVEVISSMMDVPIEITDITFTGASVDDVITLPTTFPVTITAVDGIEILWNGPGTDATTCLPLNSIDFTISYTCLGKADIVTTTFNLTEKGAAVL